MVAVSLYTKEYFNHKPATRVETSFAVFQVTKGPPIQPGNIGKATPGFLERVVCTYVDTSLSLGPREFCAWPKCTRRHQ